MNHVQPKRIRAIACAPSSDAKPRASPCSFLLDRSFHGPLRAGLRVCINKRPYIIYKSFMRQRQGRIRSKVRGKQRYSRAFMIRRVTYREGKSLEKKLGGERLALIVYKVDDGGATLPRAAPIKAFSTRGRKSGAEEAGVLLEITQRSLLLLRALLEAVKVPIKVCTRP